MNTPLVTLIVAVADSGVIGRDNSLPWHLPADLQRFKRITMGKPILMGRKTFESIGKPLPGRENIVVTRDTNYRRDGIRVVHDAGSALRAAGVAPEVMVIGGAELFRAFLPLAGRIHLTRVHGNIAGDVMWPALDERAWRVVEREVHAADERHAYAMTFEVWEKR
ncbi:MAG TPA: dihydrofolate reductase [Steroidobacteraceae bacterium]|nr:dihydrofolate reductase [Steroidobacteraceae bacterium]